VIEIIVKECTLHALVNVCKVEIGILQVDGDIFSQAIITVCDFSRKEDLALVCAFDCPTHIEH
jgi:hypothetical protein